MIDIQIDAGRWSEMAARVRSAVRATLEAEEIREAEISVAVLDDEGIRQMNRNHLDHDWVTDVISFPLWVEGERVVGDVYLGGPQAERQASEAGVPVAEEFARLAVHGTLHVLGWEHPESPEERADSEMYLRQEEILAAVSRSTGASR